MTRDAAIAFWRAGRAAGGRLRRLAWWLLAASGVAPAFAQPMTLAPSDALKCMTPPPAERGTPVYPEALFERKDGGTVRVELAFGSADAPPALRVLDANAAPGLVDAVERHVWRLRVPCLPAGAEPARIVMEFVFRPDDGRRVAALPPTDQGDVERGRQLACLTRIEPGVRPEYPEISRRFDEQGTYLVEMRFTDPAQRPELRVIAGPAVPRLRKAVEDFAAGYRLPCLRGGPLVATTLYKFQMVGGARTLIRDLQLTQFLGAAESMPLPARFDFNTMGCPFDVRVVYYRPYTMSRVDSLGEARPERREFLAWLSAVRLRLSEAKQLEVLGSEFTVSVPCAKMNL